LEKSPIIKPPLRSGVYLRWRISSDDCRQVILAMVTDHKPDTHGRTIMNLVCSVDGENIIDYNAERDDYPASQINKIYRSLLDGSYPF